MFAISVSEFEATGSPDMSWFQTLPAGNTGQAGAEGSGAALGAAAPPVSPAATTSVSAAAVRRIPIPIMHRRGDIPARPPSGCRRYSSSAGHVRRRSDPDQATVGTRRAAAARARRSAVPCAARGRVRPRRARRRRQRDAGDGRALCRRRPYPPHVLRLALPAEEGRAGRPHGRAQPVRRLRRRLTPRRLRAPPPARTLDGMSGYWQNVLLL